MSFLREAIKNWLLRRDAVLSRPPGQFNVCHYKWPKIRDRGLKLDWILDGGAHRGGFVDEMKPFFPNAKMLLVEPRAEERPYIDEVVKRHTGLQVAQTVLGPHEGTIEFHESGAQSSFLANSTGKSFGKRVSHPMTTIDKLFESRGLPYPDLIKLDLQGGELGALKGAPSSLAHAQAVLAEVSFIAFQDNQPLAVDVMHFLDQAGFQLYDIFLLAHRPLDGALAQGDFLFLKKTSPLLADRRWSADASWT